MTSHLIRKHCELDSNAPSSGTGDDEQQFPPRAHDRILKVARTLADLDSSERIQGNNFLEAVNYRTLDRALWS